MIKKIIKWIGGIIGGILLLVIVASVAIMLIVNKDMVSAQMQKALNRQVSIGSVHAGLFAAVSGIEVKDVAISNFKTPEQLKALEGKPVPANDLFVGLKSFTFKVKFLPLLHKEFILKELVLKTPVINISRDKNGLFNFSDLIAPKKQTADEIAAAKKKAAEDAVAAKKKAEEAAKNPSKPFTVDDLPIQITVGKVGLENGTITFEDQGTKQTVQLYNVTAKVYDIQIDPRNLAKKNNVKLNVTLGIKTIGAVPSGSVQSFDVGFSVDGIIHPFDLKTREVNPEAIIKAGSTYGTMTGLQIFEKMKAVDALSKYCGKLDFLQKAITWKDAFVNVWYKDGVAKLTNGRIKTEDYLLNFDGSINTRTNDINLNAEMILAAKHTEAIRRGIAANVKKGIQSGMEKYVTPEKIADTAMKPMLNPEGRAYMKYAVTGTLSAPNTTMVAPQLPSLTDMISDAVKKAGGAVADQAKAAAQAQMNKKKEQAAGAAQDKAQGALKKKLKF